MIATYLPPWVDHLGRRTPGVDEDAVTMAVAAGTAALGHRDHDLPPIHEVVVVSRQPVLLEGDSGAAVLAGLGLGDDTGYVECLGGAPDTLAALATAMPNTLVIGVDAETVAGAAAALVTEGGASLVQRARLRRSVPVRTRWPDGETFEYDDARFARVRGVAASLERAGLLGAVDIVAGLPAGAATTLAAPGSPALETTGASAPLFALAAMVEGGLAGVLAAIEQANVFAVDVAAGTNMAIVRNEPAPAAAPDPVSTTNMMKMSLPAYERAFDAKVRFEAGCCPKCETLAFPPRRRCLECGHDGDQGRAALPRTGSVYTTVTVHVPVPGLPAPYSLAIVALDETDVRALVPVTGVPAGAVAIGDRGTLVLRRVAIRAGVPDYGFAFYPEVAA